MRACGRASIAVTAAAALFAAAAWPSLHLSLVIHREAYRASEWIGIMDPTGALGGQIKGFNYQRHPAWVHPVAAGLGSVVGFGPALIAALQLYHYLAYGRAGATFCGRCGRVLRHLTEPRCPSCGADL